MGIGPDHHTAGKGIIFQNHLVDDSSAWLPETNAVFIGNRGKKIIYLPVCLDRQLEVFFGTHFSLDKVITMDCGGNSNFITSAGHKLEQSHLSRSILHS